MTGRRGVIGGRGRGPGGRLSGHRTRTALAGALVLAALLGGCADVAADEPAASSTPPSSSTAPGSSATTNPAATPTSSVSTTPPAATPSATPSATPTAPVTPSTSPSTTPTTKPSGTPVKPPAKVNYALQVEKRLSAWGFPVGDVDGEITPRSRQALCAWREASGLPISRGRLTTADVRSVLLAKQRPVPAKPSGIYVNKTCQVLFQVADKTYRRIVWVSSGSAQYETPNGTGKVWRKRAGVHESSLYDEAYMYDSIYFLKDRPGIALHGSRVNSLVKTYPDSHSCIRVLRPQIHRIFTETPIGTRVSVYGKY